MKLSSLFSLLGVAALFLLSIGCRTEKSEPYGPDLAAKRKPLALSQVRSEDRTSQDLLAQKLLKGFARAEEGPFTVDLIGPTTLLTVLLNASENESLTALTKGMEIRDDRHDLFTKSLQAQLDHLRSLDGSPVRDGSALWMVWPILLTPDFQNEMGERLGASVYRLGNAGITASNRIEKWSVKAGADSPMRIALDKRDVMLGTTHLHLDLGRFQQTSVLKQGERDIVFFKSEKGLSAVLVTGSDPEGILARESLDQLQKRSAASAPKEAHNLYIPGNHPSLLTEGFKEAGFDFIFSGANDWRYMAMELRQTSLAAIHGGLSLESQAESAEGTESGIFLIFEPESGLILAGGRTGHPPTS